MEDLQTGIQKMSSDERRVLALLVYLAEKYLGSFTPLDNRLDSQTQIVRQVFDALRQDSRFRT